MIRMRCVGQPYHRPPLLRIPTDGHHGILHYRQPFRGAAIHKPRCVSTGVVGNACRRAAQVDTHADALATFIENMRGLADGIRWVRRTNLHLTLRFLGDAVDPKRLAA